MRVVGQRVGFGFEGTDSVALGSLKNDWRLEQDFSKKSEMDSTC